MNRRPLAALAIVLLAAAFALAGVLAFGHTGASAAGPGYHGYGMMMGGYGSGNGGNGPGMMGGSDGAGRSSGAAVLLIRHQQAHCHTWSGTGGPFRAGQTLTLKRGATVTVVNDDVMPHGLVELAGTRVSMHNGTTMPMMSAHVGTSKTAGLMNYMGSTTSVAFGKAGVYRFRTRAGEDYFPGIRTTGADNVLTLTVTVR